MLWLCFYCVVTVVAAIGRRTDLLVANRIINALDMTHSSARHRNNGRLTSISGILLLICNIMRVLEVHEFNG